LRESLEQIASARQRQQSPEVRAQKLAARAAMYRRRTLSTEAPEATLDFLAFSKGRQRYGIPTESVLEVLTLEKFSPVPRAPAFVPGVISWRGVILAILDLSRLFDIAEAGLADVHYCVVVEAAGRRVALIAREIEEIHRAPRSRIKPAPELGGAAWVLGVHDDNRLILSVEAILQDPRLTEWRKA
jgi:purine-binding chemotaxis protein CheW